MNNCPHCGADLPEGAACSDLFDAAQFKEIADPRYYAVHHLSVPCYMLQHDVYSARGWREVRDLLRRFLEEDLTPEQARREISGQFSGSRKGWSLTKGERLPGLAAVRWTRTIAGVPLDTPEHYRAGVRAWAASILDDTRGL